MSFSWAVSNQRPTAGGVVTGCAGDQGKFTVKVVGISQTNFTPDPLDLKIPLWIGSHKELPSVTVDINGQRHVLQNVTFTSYESAGKDTRSGVFTFAR